MFHSQLLLGSPLTMQLTKCIHMVKMLYMHSEGKAQISFGVQHIQTEGFHLFLKLKVNSINTSGLPPSTTLLISQDLIQYYKTCTVETAALNNTRLNQIKCIHKRQHSTCQCCCSWL